MDFIGAISIDTGRGDHQNVVSYAGGHVTIKNLVLVALFFSSFLLTSISQAQVTRYRVVPITSPYPERGFIVGIDMNKAAALPLTRWIFQRRQPFVWKEGTATPLTLLGGYSGTAWGINSAGHITGGAYPAGKWKYHAYIYRNGGTEDLGTFGGTSATGMVVNRYDQIAGSYTIASKNRVFFWDRGNWVDIGGLGGSSGMPWGLNNSGTLVGQLDVSDTPDPVFGIPPFHAFSWAAGSLTDLGTAFGSNYAYGDAINEAGIIAGSADTLGDTGARAVLWNNGAIEDLTPYDNIVSWAADINNKGQVVGAFGDVDDPSFGPPVNGMACPCFGVLWQNGQMYYLDDLVPPEWSIWLGIAINDNGAILARGKPVGGKLQLVLLRPIPDSTVTPSKIMNRAIVSRPDRIGPRALRRSPDGTIQEVE
jgi:probable HAF family extracellular repeat protein